MSNAFGGFSWTESSEPREGDGGHRAPRIPDGDHDVAVAKVVFGKGNTLFQSNNRDPQILVIFADEEGREASEMFTLSDRAAWKLALVLRAAGANVQKMDERGVKPTDFADEEFCEKNLVRRRLRVNVQWETGTDGKAYANIRPIMPQPGQQRPSAPPPQQPRPQSPPPPDEPRRSPGSVSRPERAAAPAAAAAGNGSRFNPEGNLDDDGKKFTDADIPF